MSHSEALASFRICRDEVKHEYGVLANRLNSYLISQSFLVSAYAVAMGNLNPQWGHAFRLFFPVLLCLLGIVLTANAMPGLSGVCEIIGEWHNRQVEIFQRCPGLDEYGVLKTQGVAEINQRNLWFAMNSPWIFGGAWIVMAIISTTLFLS